MHQAILVTEEAVSAKDERYIQWKNATFLNLECVFIIVILKNANNNTTMNMDVYYFRQLPSVTKIPLQKPRQIVWQLTALL